ncbi:GATA-type zinc finger protein 1 [Poecilia reticulata]|uniref:GATA-type zinc finger protein 1 n=1 Tax=Poecilia reticulata TaxID=8081 RepID=UPI0004A244AF|nr:PREDICTED: GATA-type zinc finger protein 1 [Poecilia reticulata]XP_008413618.1 PREDICTED: GATA-type zinc finger protein 1 [Poecilia reticulata]
MSTAPRTEAAFIQDNQSKAEHNDSHSALFYLFHEVSKLATPIHKSLFDTNPASKKPTEASDGNSCITEKEERATSNPLEDPSGVKDGDEHLFQSSCSSHRHSLCCMIPNSPWKVLSLINLHCERLLHDKDAEDAGLSLGSSSRVSHSNAKFATASPGVTKGGNTEDSLEGTSGLSLQLCERRISPASVVDLKMGSSEEVEEDSGEGCSLQIHSAEKTAAHAVALCECSSAVTLQPLHSYSEKPSVGKRQSLIQECKKDWFHTENDHLNALFPENALQQAQISSVCSTAQITFSSTYMECTEVPQPGLTLDLNANFTLSTEKPCNTQLPPTSAGLLSPQSGQYDQFSASKTECCHVPQEESHPVADYSTVSSCTVSYATDIWKVSNDEKDQLSTNKCRTKTRRKQPHPSRSADGQDPDFQGVTFRIDTELDDNRQQSRLLITSKYSKKLCKSVRKPKLRTRALQKLAKTSSSDEENDHTTNINKGKICASCCTRKTPMWRDAEDGTPLCNACGIRYKKYRVRCVKCWHIPRKEGNSSSLCIRCGNLVKLTSAQRKHPS